MRRTRSASRRPARRRPAARVVVTERESTEPKYLRVFDRILESEQVRLDIIGLGGDPKAVVQRAVKESKKVKGDPNAKDDTFWAMFDRDDHPRFDAAKDMAHANRIYLAVSNPCFELWGILHYQDQDASLDRADCQKKLETLCPGYKKAGEKVFDDPEVIENCYELAVERAEKLLRRREEEDRPEGNPSTSVHRLTEHIGKFIDPS